MNASAIGTATRAFGLAVVIVLAAVVGLMVGNALQGRGATNAGYPEGWQGGAAVPLSRTADTSFSLDAAASFASSTARSVSAAERCCMPTSARARGVVSAVSAERTSTRLLTSA